MRYLSDKTRKVYNSIEELQKEEKKYDAEQAKNEVKKAERARRAKEVEDAYKVASDAIDNAEELLSKFVKDYGSFHTTINNGDLKPFKEVLGFPSFISEIMKWF